MADQKQRSLAKGRFTRAEKVLLKDLEAEENTIPLITIERHLKDFLEKWEKVQDLHDEYVMMLVDPTDDELAAQEEWLDELSERFAALEVQVDSVVERRRKEAVLSESVNKAVAETEEVETAAIVEAEAGETVEADTITNNAVPTADAVQEDAPNVVSTDSVDTSTLENSEQQAQHNQQLQQDQQSQQQQTPQQLQQHQHVQVVDHEQHEHVIQQQQQQLLIHKQRQVLDRQLHQVKQMELQQQQQLQAHNELTGLMSGSVVDNKENVPSNNQNITQPISRLKIKPLDIQHFAGDIRKFAQFKDEFNSLIKPLCAPNQLALALRNHLTGEVRAAVESVGNDYEKMWKRLELKYGSTRRLVEAILRDVKTMQIDGDEIVDALEMIDVVEKAHLDLAAIGEEEELYNATIISLIEERLPSEMMSEWVKCVAGDQHLRSQEKFQTLLKLLKNWRYRLEYLNDSMRSTSAITLHIQGDANKSHQKQTCWIHKEAGDHPIWRCRVFRTKTVDERVQLTKDNHACFTCLEVGHGTDKCNRKFVCKIDNCNQNHNQLLHKGAGLPPGAVLPQQ